MNRLILSVIICLFVFIPHSQASLSELCYEQELLVAFPCQESWDISRIDNDLFVVISKSPFITLTVTQIDSRIVYLSQLNRLFLEEMGLYKDGFQIEEDKISGKRAIKVKAFSVSNNDKRKLDYFIFNDGKLFGLLFSVEPKEEWDQSQLLIKQITSQFEFL